ncbi:hypothetical protein OO007_12130 [Cocleimonas sp. KMM 6892]|uniref:hypothetical protein n=1 Tax=unclassified Cocleimonas TaxID=2639732 RepID=UPI002DBA40CF|nr:MULTISPECIES: hypothetical protein [unclassified Cocleimonas]MEB8432976.1 hypothetical protein [Cocleimonas sp. KMM 6892]MEC4716043.1 hypothetical protein [Cocleimonas sp. KMM 6895]MEC4745504.1 hypothetical protein [Cocleimonas sp. KMM 6896]
MFLTACGGGGSGSLPNTNPITPTTPTTDYGYADDAETLSRLKGVWQGAFKTYDYDTTDLKCDYQVTMNLDSTKVPDGVSFLSSDLRTGNIAFEALNGCNTASYEIEWAALCTIGQTSESVGYSCLLDIEDINSDRNSDDPYISSAVLSVDESRLFQLRTGNDDDYLDLRKN